MVAEVVMPRLGWTMEKGTVAEWLKKDRDEVQAGEIIFTVESDKAVQEVEAMDSGILRVAPGAPAQGEDAPVGAVLAYILKPDEADIPVTNQVASVPELEPSRDTASQVAAGNKRIHDGASRTVASPRARRIAAELGVDWTAATGSGRSGRIVERDVRALATQSDAVARARVTPLARRLAEETGVDLAVLVAKKPGQRIVRADIEAATRDATDVDTPETPAAIGHRVPTSQVRRITAERMAQSAHTVAPVTLMTEADATELVALRNRIKAARSASGRPSPSYNDLLVRLATLVLLEHPWMNSSLTDDGIVQHDAVHVGIAVDTERGLFVPVIRNAHQKSIQQIAEESARLINQTREGQASGDDLRGGTFTISNLGMYEIDGFTPIINIPECAILGVGRIVARPVVVDEETEETAVRKMMALSLTFDHRIVDGGPAARFLQQVKRWIEQPYVWLTL